MAAKPGTRVWPAGAPARLRASQSLAREPKVWAPEPERPEAQLPPNADRRPPARILESGWLRRLLFWPPSPPRALRLVRAPCSVVGPFRCSLSRQADRGRPRSLSPGAAKVGSAASGIRGAPVAARPVALAQKSSGECLFRSPLRARAGAIHLKTAEISSRSELPRRLCSSCSLLTTSPLVPPTLSFQSPRWSWPLRRRSSRTSWRGGFIWPPGKSPARSGCAPGNAQPTSCTAATDALAPPGHPGSACEIAISLLATRVLGSTILLPCALPAGLVLASPRSRSLPLFRPPPSPRLWRPRSISSTLRSRAVRGFHSSAEHPSGERTTRLVAVTERNLCALEFPVY